MSESNPFLWAQLINVVVPVAWLLLALWGLFTLRARHLSSTAKAIWALIILFGPIVGVLAFFIVNPRE